MRHKAVGFIDPLSTSRLYEVKEFSGILRVGSIL